MIILDSNLKIILSKYTDLRGNLSQKTHYWKVVGSNPHCGEHFSCTIHLDQSMEAKIEWKLTWHCCICCNPAKGRVDFEDGRLIKSSFIRMKWKLVSWPGPNSHTKKIKNGFVFYRSYKRRTQQKNSYLNSFEIFESTIKA